MQLPTQQESRLVVSKDDEHLAGVLRAQGGHPQGCFPTTAEDMHGEAGTESTDSTLPSALQAQTAATLHIWHSDGRLGPAGCVESSSP